MARRCVVQDAHVAKLPTPPEPKRTEVISVRLSKDELAQLERAKVLLAQHWKRDTEDLDRADVIRAAVGMLAEELEAQVGKQER